MNFGLIMSSAFINLLGSYVGGNLTIQYLEGANQAAGWKDLARCRTVFTGGFLISSGYISQTMIIPSALRRFLVNDKIRMILLKPIGANPVGFEISKPTGSIYIVRG